MSILLPALGRAREQANFVKCQSNFRQWGVAMILYTDANKQVMPQDAADGDRNTRPIINWGGPQYWFNALPPLVASKPYDQLQVESASGGSPLPIEGDNSLFVCPSSSQAASLASPDVVTPDGYFQMWGTVPPSTAAVARKTFVCYVINSKMNQTKPVSKLTQLRPSSSTVIMTEKRMRQRELKPGSPYIGKTLARLKADWQRFAARHREGGNLLFADGSVQFFLNKDLAPVEQTGRDYNIPNVAVWNPFGPATTD